MGEGGVSDFVPVMGRAGGWFCPCLKYGINQAMEAIKYYPQTEGITDYRCTNGCVWQFVERDGASFWHYIGRPSVAVLP